jgi:hypothetical protein
VCEVCNMHQLRERLACACHRQAAESRRSVREACGDELCIQGQPCSLLKDFSSFNKSVTKRLSTLLVHHSLKELKGISPLSESWASTVWRCITHMNVRVRWGIVGFLGVPLSFFPLQQACQWSLFSRAYSWALV